MALRPHSTANDRRCGLCGEILLDLAPDEGAVEQHVRAMIGMHRRALRRIGRFAVEHERQRLVVHAHQLGGILGERAAVGDHRRHPFPAIARDLDGERPPRHLGRIEAGQQRRGGGRQLAAVEHVVHAGHGQRRGGVDRKDARGRMGRRDHGNMAGAGQHDVGGEAALAGDEAPILAHAPVRRHETEARRGHGAVTGWLRPRMRSAASAIASMIWA